MRREDTQITLRIPADAKAFIAAQVARNGSSQNSEIIRCIRDRMERTEKWPSDRPTFTKLLACTASGGELAIKKIATTGSEFGDKDPADAGNNNIPGEC